ncbi:hypothetical protein HPB49_004768 [Dermacentor silvarum]|uniref:Uncharacterized protein n=1 Tax=Dermacentor silvarum TaxID=543639 RepID=A0ACB8DB45_DERSI|nr:hypothetical protein HPB49_004768 [Dermacentor silvarum]
MVFCSVVGCSNRSDISRRKKKPTNTNFFRIPRILVDRCKRSTLSTNRRTLWLARINRADLDPQNPNLRVCGAHFVTEATEPQNTTERRVVSSFGTQAARDDGDDTEATKRHRQMTTVGVGIQTLKTTLDTRCRCRLETMSPLAGLFNTARNLRGLQQQEDPGGDPPWLVQVERADAERLLSGARDGSFVVRPSRGEAPFALSLRFGGRPFHLRVRRRADGRLALGSEKPRERSFDSLVQLVEHHCREPILLTSRGRPAGRTTLAPPPLT